MDHLAVHEALAQRAARLANGGGDQSHTPLIYISYVEPLRKYTGMWCIDDLSAGGLGGARSTPAPASSP